MTNPIHEPKSNINDRINTLFQKYKNTKIQKYKNTKIQKYKKYKNTKIQKKYKNTENLRIHHFHL